MERESSSALSRSPDPAARPMARSWSVTPAIALTTATGACGRRSRTMAAARSMAAASPTEVPPNFITIMPALPGGSFRQISLRMEQLSVQQGRARRSADHVVREHSELPIEKIARAQAPDGNRHPGARVDVEAWLRAVGGAHVDNG